MDLWNFDYVSNWLQAPEIVALSSESQNHLKKELIDFKDTLQSSDINQFTQLAADSRASFSASSPCRLLFLVEHTETPIEVIEKIAEDLGKNPEPFWSSRNAYYSELDCPGKLAFVFPGQGSQYPFMGQELMQFFPEVSRCLAAVNDMFDPSANLTDLIYPQPAGKENEKVIFEENLRSTDIAQPAIGVISAAMLKILDRFGIKPDSTCGHSYGELSALFASGRFDESMFYSLSVARGKYMANAAGTGDKGGMLAVKAPLDRINDLIQSSGLDVILANRNSPDQGVLSGPTDAINQMKVVCKENKIRAIILPVAAAFHSKLVKDAAEPFQNKIASIEFSGSKIPVYSNTTGVPYPDPEEETKEILGRHLLNPVYFIDEIQNMYKNGLRIFIEVGPRTVLPDIFG